MAINAPDYFTPADPGPPPVDADVILADPNGTLAGAAGPIAASGPLTDAISKVWPMPGTDTDNDGLPDALELQMDVLATLLLGAVFRHATGLNDIVIGGACFW